VCLGEIELRRVLLTPLKLRELMSSCKKEKRRSFVHGFIFFKLHSSVPKGRDCRSGAVFLPQPVLNEPLHGLEVCREIRWGNKKL